MLENFAPHCSVTILLVISCERYRAICHPMKRGLGGGFTTIIPIIWLLVIAISIPFSFMSYLQDAVFHDGSHVQVCRTSLSKDWHYAYVIAMFILFFAVPLCVLVVMYCAIVRQVSKEFLPNADSNNRSVSSSRYRKQIILMIIGVIVLFFVCLIPIKVLALWLIFAAPSDLVTLGFEGYTNLLSSSRILLYMNSAGNPVIYGLISARFRKAFKKSLLGCCNSKVSFRQSFKSTTSDGVDMTLVENTNDKPMVTQTKGLRKQLGRNSSRMRNGDSCVKYQA